jgi:isocitrate/isopropylmalate dehydrogenase
MMTLHPNMIKKTPITVAHGDGIGPEIVTGARYDVVKTESLRNFDGKQGFTLAQGQ